MPLIDERDSLNNALAMYASDIRCVKDDVSCPMEGNTGVRVSIDSCNDFSNSLTHLDHIHILRQLWPNTPLHSHPPH